MFQRENYKGIYLAQWGHSGGEKAQENPVGAGSKFGKTTLQCMDFR